MCERVNRSKLVQMNFVTLTGDKETSSVQHIADRGLTFRRNNSQRPCGRLYYTHTVLLTYFLHTCLLTNLLICAAMKCPLLTSPNYTEVVSGDPRVNLFNETIVYACAEGHELIAGDLSTTCLSSKTWSGETPVCRSKTWSGETPVCRSKLKGAL